MNDNEKNVFEEDAKAAAEDVKTPEEATEAADSSENSVDSHKAAEDGAKENKKSSKNLKKELDAAKKEIETKAAEYNDLSDKYTRMMAEYDNFRKRAQKEKESIYADAYADAITQLLGVKDNLELAVKYADKEKFAEGVVMTLNKFTEILGKLGVEEFGEVGETFDPNIHNAVFHAEEEGAPENSIAEVLLKGYKKGEKIIRFAMVKVVN